MIGRILAGTLLALGLGIWIEQARADQAFVCDGNDLLVVKSRDVERLKRQNPCVANHFGLKIAAAPAITATVPLPARNPAASVAKHATARSPALGAPDRPASSRGVVIASDEPARSPALVRIINARPGADPWLRLDR